MTEQEKKLLYNYEGTYKGWSCIEIGCGLVLMKKGSKQLRLYKSWDVENWVNECWRELKSKIDKIESK